MGSSKVGGRATARMALRVAGGVIGCAMSMPALAQNGMPFSAPWQGDAAPVQPDGEDGVPLQSGIGQGRAVMPVARPLFGSSAVAPAANLGLDRSRAIDCMTAAIAYEAGHEPLAGKEAVAQVILNRVRHPRFPKTVCGVVFDGSHRSTGCQFTFTCDGSLGRRLRPDTLDMARVVAVSVIDGLVPDRVAGATHYHANYVNPYWASSGQVTARIGAHLFYRMPSDGGPGASGPLVTSGETSLAMVDGALAPRASRRRAAVTSTVVPVARFFAPWGLPVAGLGAPQRLPRP